MTDSLKQEIMVTITDGVCASRSREEEEGVRLDVGKLLCEKDH